MDMRALHNDPPALKGVLYSKITSTMWGGGDAVHCLLETAVKRGTDLIMMREPPARLGYAQPGFDLLRGNFSSQKKRLGVDVLHGG